MKNLVIVESQAKAKKIQGFFLLEYESTSLSTRAIQVTSKFEKGGSIYNSLRSLHDRYS